MYIGLQIKLNHQDGTSLNAGIVGLHDNGILITIPRDRLHEVSAGDVVNVEYIDENNNHPKVFTTEIKKHIRATNLVLAAYPDNIHKIERRNFYRVTPWTEMEIHYSISDLDIDPNWLRFKSKSKNAVPILPSSYRKAKLVDISGGGIAIATSSRLKEGSRIGLFLQLKNNYYKINGVIVGCAGEEKPYKLAIEFIDLKPFHRDRIIRFVFEQASGFIREEIKQRMRRKPQESQQESQHTSQEEPQLEVQAKKELSQANQRETLRLNDLAVPIEFKIVRDYVDAVRLNYQSGLLRNLSITGASFLAKFEIPLNSNIWVKIPIEDEFIRILGKCLRSRAMEDLDDYEIGIKFKALEGDMMKRLTAFIYTGQLKDSLYPMPDEPIPQE